MALKAKKSIPGQEQTGMIKIMFISDYLSKVKKNYGWFLKSEKSTLKFVCEIV